MKRKPKTTETFAAKPATPEQLQGDFAAPTDALGQTAGVDRVFAVRNAIDATPAGGWTPMKLARVIANARTLTDTATYFSLAEELEEKDANWRSVIATRKLAVAALPFKVSPASDSARDRKIAKFVQAQLDKPAVRSSLKNLLDAISKGVSVNEIVWKATPTEWTVERIEYRDPRHFVFDKTDGRTLRLLPDTMGAAPIDLPANKFIIHTPNSKSGLPIRSGLAMVAAWSFVLKWLAKKDWNAFGELCLKPGRLGRYKPGTSKEDLAVLKRAVQQLGSDFSAILPENLSIEFIKDAGVSGSAAAYESLIRYLDEQNAKLALGASLTSGTSNTGSGGSQALGVVHNELRADIMRDDAADAAATLARDLVAPLVRFNFGADAAIPTVQLVVEEAEDLVALAGIAEKLTGLGVPLSKAGLAARFNLPLAETPEDTAGTAAAQPPATQGSGAFSAWAACPEHGSQSFAAKRTPLDDLADEMLGDYAAVSNSVDQALASIAADCTSLDEMRTRLAAFVQQADQDALTLLLAQARAKANALGRTGTDA